jgi:hypothetical protein
MLAMLLHSAAPPTPARLVGALGYIAFVRPAASHPLLAIYHFVSCPDRVFSVVAYTSPLFRLKTTRIDFAIPVFRRGQPDLVGVFQPNNAKSAILY